MGLAIFYTITCSRAVFHNERGMKGFEFRHENILDWFTELGIKFCVLHYVSVTSKMKMRN
jgi:hypothetical protein